MVDSKMNKGLLRFTEQGFTVLIENSPEIICRFDPGLECTYANAAFERITGYPTDRALGKPFFLSERNNGLSSINMVLRKVIQTKKPVGKELKISHAVPHKLIYLDAGFYPELDAEHKLVGVYLIAKDITALKENEKKLRLERQKAEENSKLSSIFLGKLSHEIRTPLNAIVGFSRLMKEEMVSTGEKEDMLNLIYSSGMKMIEMIENLIDLSKIETGQLDLNCSLVDIYDFMVEAYAQLKGHLVKEGKQDVIGTFLVCPDYFKTNRMSIETDRKRLSQVLSTLISNAVKFTREGQITLGVKKAEESSLTFYIEDSGLGIPKGKKKIIFDPFRQVNNTYSRVYEGMGIGLSLAMKVARAMNGDIDFKSEVGLGSTFYFYLPGKLLKEDDPHLQIMA